MCRMRAERDPPSRRSMRRTPISSSVRVITAMKHATRLTAVRDDPVAPTSERTVQFGDDVGVEQVHRRLLRFSLRSRER